MSSGSNRKNCLLFVSGPARTQCVLHPFAIAPRGASCVPVRRAIITRKGCSLFATSCQGVNALGENILSLDRGRRTTEARATADSRRFEHSRYCALFGGVPYQDVAVLYSACDVFVLPTLQDYRSVAVMEAASHGKAILDSKYDGGAMEFVRNGDNGFTFRPKRSVGISQSYAKANRQPRPSEVFREKIPRNYKALFC